MTPADVESPDSNPDQSMIDALGDQDDRREFERFPYPVSQSFVPVMEDDPAVPQWEKFGTVQCLDISAGGVAFVWPEEPNFTHGVMALGTPPKLILMRLTVAETHLKDDQVVVGCQFTERIADDES